MSKADLLTRANEILADCNQTPSAREVIAELVERIAELHGRKTAAIDQNASDELHITKLELDVIVLEQRIATLQAALEAAHRCLMMDEDAEAALPYADVEGYKWDSDMEIINKALAILTPTPKASPAVTEAQQGVPE